MNVCVVPSAAPEVAEATEGVVVSVNCRGAFAIHTFGFFVQIRRVSQLSKILSTQHVSMLVNIISNIVCLPSDCSFFVIPLK